MMNLPRGTRIFATIGTVTESPEILGKLIKVGMNVARINMSHANENGLCYDGSTWGQSLGDIYLVRQYSASCGMVAPGKGHHICLYR